MLKDSIGKDGEFCPSVSSKLQQVTLNSVRDVLPDRAIEQACHQVQYAYRQRKITPIVTVLHMVLAAVWPEESLTASWHVLWDWAVACFPGLNGRSPSSGSVAKARARLPVRLWHTIFAWVAARAGELSEPFAFWRGHRVVLVDGTCVSMPDRPELHAAFGTSTGRGGRGKYPLARMVTLALAQTMTVVSYALGRYRDSEKALLKTQLGRLRPGDLLVGDRHFAGANLYADYLSAGLMFLTRAHQCLKVSRLRRIVSYAIGDFVTDLTVNAKHRREDPSLPKRVRVRMIQAVLRIRGKRQTVWFATSLLDAQKYPAAEVVALYARRWRIETLFRQVKVRLSADVLRSKNPDGVRKEVAARLLAVNVVRMIMLQAAIENGCDPVEISFAHALRAIVAFAPALANAPLWKLHAIYHAMLTEIAAHRINVRPGRHEPRAVRRETKHYPTLKTTRAEWRLAHVA